ncbi:MAG TPA: hypothetical protein VKU00_27105 [Chthonomonadaceae bacterium]|nr:hypothetical protein [Chthonomonadaceae bacterium]
MKRRDLWLEFWEWSALQRDAVSEAVFQRRAALFALDRLIRTRGLLPRRMQFGTTIAQRDWKTQMQAIFTPSPAIEHRLVSLFSE